MVRTAINALDGGHSDRDLNAAPSELAKTLCELLMQDVDVAAVHNSVVRSIGHFVGLATELDVSLEMASKGKDVADLWQLIKDRVRQLKAQSVAREADLEITSMVDDNIFWAHRDNTAYEPSESELAILEAFIVVARELWLWVSLCRFLHPRQCCRCPVLLAMTGLAYLIEPLNKALSRIG